MNNDDKNIHIKNILGGEIGCGKITGNNLTKLKKHIKNGTFNDSDFVENPFNYADNYTTGILTGLNDELSKSAYVQDDEIIGFPKDDDGHYKAGIYLLYGQIANYNIEIENIKSRDDLKFLGKIIDTGYFELDIAGEITGSLLVDYIIIDGEKEFLYDYLYEKNVIGHEVVVVEITDISDDGHEPDMGIVEIVRYVEQVD